jgi:hypothetical protein
MIHRVTYKNIDEYTVDISVLDDHGIRSIGTATKSTGLKWKLKAFFPVDAADVQSINKLYDGPVEGGRELVKAWEYYKSYELKDTAELFMGDLFK